MEETGNIKRVSYEGELYINIDDLMKAFTTIRDNSWHAGLCSAAFVMDSFTDMLKSEFFRDN